jgi:peptide/nickel transport system substrate-binding protein
MREINRYWAACAVAALVMTVAGCGNSTSVASTPVEKGSRATLATPRRGGEATVLLGSDFIGAWPTGLDPATNITGGANLSLMNAIFGGLMQIVADEDGSHPRVVGVLAESFDMADGGRTLRIHLRQGVTFSDGTPFDAEAVRFNMERNLASPCSCSPKTWPWPQGDPVSVVDAHTVALHFSRPNPAAINVLPSTNLNWIGSPKAIREMGDRFRISPVGAGPFRVVSNQLSTRLVLERNPKYWQPDRPYLDRLVFQSIGNEQAGIQALLAGDAQAYEALTSVLLIEQALARKELTVTQEPPTSPYLVQLNTQASPFNDQRAREAIYYATNSEAIRQGVFKNRRPVSQSFTGPGGLFYHAQVPGYRTYDLEKARARVKELGKLEITIGTLRTNVAEQVITALQTDWQRAGIKVKIETYDLGGLIDHFQKGNWQALLQTAGAYDPEAGAGIRFRFASNGTFTGVHDPQLDAIFDSAASTVDPQERDRLYAQAARLISDKAYAPFVVPYSAIQLSRGLHAPGLTTPLPANLLTSAILWQDAWMSR